MATINLNIDDNKIKLLQQKAEEFGLTLNDLINATFDDLISKPDDDFTNAVNHIINKNKKLYEKLS